MRTHLGKPEVTPSAASCSVQIDPDAKISAASGAKPESFQARDNIAQFLKQSRVRFISEISVRTPLQAMGVQDTVLFDVEDLVQRKTDLLCQWQIVISLLEVA